MGVLHRVRLALGLTQAKVCVLVLGLPHAGQSSCIAHFGGAAHTTQEVDTPGGPQCQAHTLRVQTRGGQLRKLVALDFGETTGEEAAAQLQWQAFFGVAQAVMWVVDARQTDRLQHVQDALDRACSHPELKDVPLCVVVNTAGDRDAGASVEQVSAALNLYHVSGGHRPWHIVEANAVTGVGLTDAWEWLLEHSIRRREGLEKEATEAMEATRTPAAALTA